MQVKSNAQLHLGQINRTGRNIPSTEKKVQNLCEMQSSPTAFNTMILQ